MGNSNMGLILNYWDGRQCLTKMATHIQWTTQILWCYLHVFNFSQDHRELWSLARPAPSTGQACGGPCGASRTARESLGFLVDPALAPLRLVSLTSRHRSRAASFARTWDPSHPRPGLPRPESPSAHSVLYFSEGRVAFYNAPKQGTIVNKIIILFL